MSTNLSHLTYIQQPPAEAWVERQPNGDLLIRWTPEATTVRVYCGATPETIDRATPLLTVPAANGREALVGQPNPARRPTFELEFAGGPADGRRLQVAERILPLHSGVNFRDIGGYATRDGRAVRWGRVYRSGSLNGLTGDDLSLLSDLGLRVSCDLRTASEAAERPDRLPPSAEYWHLPVGGHVSRVRRTLVIIWKRNRLQEVLQEAYTHVMVDQNGEVFGDLFRKLAQPDQLPLVVHCTAGKDRTGVAVALLLAALGVGDETIAADYSLSNQWHDVFTGQMAKELRRMFSLGFDEEQVRAFFLAEPRTILGTLAHIRGRYGSVRDYLSRMGGVTPDVLQRVQDNLLT